MKNSRLGSVFESMLGGVALTLGFGAFGGCGNNIQSSSDGSLFIRDLNPRAGESCVENRNCYPGVCTVDDSIDAGEHYAAYVLPTCSMYADRFGCYRPVSSLGRFNGHP